MRFIIFCLMLIASAFAAETVVLISGNIRAAISAYLTVFACLIIVQMMIDNRKPVSE